MVKKNEAPKKRLKWVDQRNGLIVTDGRPRHVAHTVVRGRTMAAFQFQALGAARHRWATPIFPCTRSKERTPLNWFAQTMYRENEHGHRARLPVWCWDTVTFAGAR